MKDQKLDFEFCCPYKLIADGADEDRRKAQAGSRRALSSFLILLACILTAVALPPVTHASGSDDDWIQTTGDILQVALPILGGGATFFTNPEPGETWDKEGTKQFVKVFSTAWGSTYLLKSLAGKARPNGANRTSFPSGHTMSAFVGAAFIDGRYGSTFGGPAYALALFTGYSRVHSGWHYRDDVIAGASIGLMSNWLWVTPLPGKVQLIPTVNKYGYGLQVSLGGGGNPSGDGVVEAEDRNVAYRFGFGPAFVIRNTAGSQGSGDNRFVLSDLNGFNDPTTTAVVNIGLPVSRRGALAISYSPFEARDEGTFGYDVNFGGEFFSAGELLDSAWRFYDLSLMYEHQLIDTPAWGVRGTAGAGVMYSYATLNSRDNDTSALVDDETFYPFIGLATERRISRQWAFEVSAAGMAIADDWILDAGAELIWRPVRSWDISLGYKYFSRKIETDTFYNKVNYNIPFLSFARFW